MTTTIDIWKDKEERGGREFFTDQVGGVGIFYPPPFLPLEWNNGWFGLVLCGLYRKRKGTRYNTDKHNHYSYSKLDKTLQRGQISRQINNQIETQIDRQLYNQIETQIDRQINNQTETHIDIQINNQIETQIDRQINNQIEHTDRWTDI